MTALGALFCAALVTGAPPADPEVRKGLELFERLDYDRAVVVLGRALTRAELAKADRLVGLETLAFAYTILEDAVHAEQSFHKLLDLAPEHSVAKGRSPRLRNAFGHARASWLAGREVGFTLDPAAADVVGQLTGDPARLAEVRLLSDGEARALRCEGRECRGARPASAFKIELVDHTGAVLATAGPFEGAPADGLPWWAWALMGVAAAGASAIAIGAAQSQDPPPGTLGTLQLP